MGSVVTGMVGYGFLVAVPLLLLAGVVELSAVHNVNASEQEGDS